jgi:hypothetical protein
MADPDQRGNGRLDLAAGQELPDAGNIDKIRDILFGAQSREFDKRMARLDERLTKEAGNLKDDIRRRFEALETYVKRELESLSERVDAERQDRVVGLKNVSGELKEAAESVEKRLGRLDEQTTKSQRDLRQQILDQSKSLFDEVEGKYRSLLTLLDSHVETLRVDKTDRAALADLFTELALRLNNDFRLPGQE